MLLCGILDYPMYALSLLYAKLAGRFISIILFMLLFVVVFVYTKICLAVKNRQSAEIVHQLSNGHGVEHPRETNRLIKRNILMQIRMTKSCFLVVVCFMVRFFGWSICCPALYDLDVYETYALKNWEKVMIFFNSSLNSIIFLWTRPLLRNEARKLSKNSICKYSPFQVDIINVSC